MNFPHIKTAKQAAASWSKHRLSTHGAALAYYSVFSLGPIVLIISTVVGAILGPKAAEGGLQKEISAFVGPSVAKTLEQLVQGAQQSASGGWQAILGIGMLLFTATIVVVQLKESLNAVWEVPDNKAVGVWGFVRKYIISIAMVVSVGFLLTISMILTTVVSAFSSRLSAWLSFSGPLLYAINFGVTFAAVCTVFAFMFKLLPDTKVGWKQAWIGSLVTAVLFVIGKAAIEFYLGTQALDSTFGAAGSVVVLLLWIYYSSQLMLFGAEYTRAMSPADGTIEATKVV